MNKDDDQKRHEDDGIEWDNGEATYGHKLPDIKRKDEPDDKPDHDQDVSRHLKNTNLSQDEDLGNRNKDDNHGIWNKDL